MYWSAAIVSLLAVGYLLTSTELLLAFIWMLVAVLRPEK
jgi:hypothetical protein